MTDYRTPGVYVEEFEIGSRPIEGVSTSVAGIIGVAEAGPSVGLPQLVTSFADYQRLYGGYLSSAKFKNCRYLPYAVDSFFKNGGSMCYVMRVLPQGAVAAGNSSVSRSLAIQLTKDASRTDRALYLESLRGIDKSSQIKLEKICTIDGNVEYSDAALGIKSYNPDDNSIVLADASSLTHDYPKGETKATVTTLSGSLIAQPTLGITASSEGKWGENILVRATPSTKVVSRIKALLGTAATTKKYRLTNTNGFYAGAIVEFDNGSSKQYTIVVSILDDTIELGDHLTGDDTVVLADGESFKTLSVCEFDLTVIYTDPIFKRVQSEFYKGLSMNPAVSNYFMNIVNPASTLIKLSTPYQTTAYNLKNPFDMPFNDKVVDGRQYIKLTGGNDGDVDNIKADNYKGVDNGPGQRTGMQAFMDLDDVSIIAMPGCTDINAQSELETFCTNNKYCFAVLDTPANYQKISQVLAHRGHFYSSYAALYHPWIKTYDPLERCEMFIPPSGTVAGIYSRSDNTRGVHKAPANEIVRDATDLKYVLNDAEQGALNPNGVNVIRSFQGRGILVWGARTLSDNTIWQYVNARRLFIYLEKTIFRGTQWVVFEPNNEKLWARVTQTITEFLTRVWRDGALMGNKADEAFYVKCDRTTMTQNDIDTGKLIVEIGVAPVKPAEFVIFRIAQWNGTKN